MNQNEFNSLPNNIESEKLILGAVLLDAKVFKQARELNFDDFYSPFHAHVFAAMNAIDERGAKIDPILIGEELKQNGKDDAFGGVAEIANLSFGLPHFDNIKAHVELVREKALERETIRLFSHAARQVGNDSAKAVIEQTLVELNQINSRLAGNERIETDPPVINYPTLNPKALHGLAGDVVRTIEPHSEADPIAILLQFLTAFGNATGRKAHFKVEAARHFLNLFVVIVGASAKGRKGTSWNHVSDLFLRVSPDWAQNCIQSGLSSGEGLIWAVRDAIETRQPIREKARVVDYENVTTDNGITDKRLFILESEFANVLKQTHRDTNTLTVVIRDAWDKGDLRSLTKNNSAKATNAHISIVGHITKDELKRNLEETEIANGFANRFLWTCAKRSKYLPEGGNLEPSALNNLVMWLQSAIHFARDIGEMQRNDDARQLWFNVYPKLSDGNGGLFGAITSRAEAQVTRLSCLYALLDGSNIINVQHLEAALALWQYCEDSARYIFGNTTGDKTADSILDALRDASEDGLSRSQISNLFARNVNAASLSRSLQTLIERGLVESQKEKSDNPQAKRMIERFFAASRK